MNKEQAIKRCNVTAVEITDFSGDTGASRQNAIYDEVLGFVSSCEGEGALAHYSLIGDSVKSRESCARQLLKCLKNELKDCSLKRLEAEIDVFVSRDEEKVKRCGAISLIRTPVYALLEQWERNFLIEISRL